MTAMLKYLRNYFLLAILLLTACSERGQVYIEHAWVALPTDEAETTAYLEVVNPGKEAVEIVSAASEAFETVVFYLREGDEFRPVETLTVPARGHLELDGEQGHLGFSGLLKVIEDGDHLPFALAVRLHDGQLMTLEAELHVHGKPSDAGHGHEHDH